MRGDRSGSQSRSFESSRSSGPEQTQRGGQAGHTIRVNERISQRLPNNCTYTATISGTLQPVATGGGPMGAQGSMQMQTQTGGSQSMGQQPMGQQGTMAQGGDVYWPNLNINARGSCPADNIRHESRVSLRNQQISRGQLQQVVRQYSQVVGIGANGQLCTYTPQFQFQNNRLSAQNVTHSCQVARGGGPMGVGSDVNQNIPSQNAPSGSLGTSGSMDQGSQMGVPGSLGTQTGQQQLRGSQQRSIDQGMDQNLNQGADQNQYGGSMNR